MNDRNPPSTPNALLAIALTGLAVGLAGCAAQSGVRNASIPEQAGAAPPRPLEATARALAEADPVPPRSEPIIYRGTGQQVRLPAPAEPVRFVGEDVSLNFEQAPLDEIVQAVMGDILQLDYVVDHPVQGRVTLRTRTPIPRDQLLGVLESLLKAHNALLIRGSDGRYMVTGSQQSMRLSPRIGSADDAFAGYSVMVVPLQYIAASAMADILRPLAEESGLLRVDNSRNLLMLAGTRVQLSGWLDIVSTFDVDMLAGMSVGVFPLENSAVLETAEALNGLLAAGGGEGGDLSSLVRILPMQRLNSILVITPRAHYLDTLREWITRLDIGADERFEPKLYVYPVQNTTAQRLAQLLNTIYSGSPADGSRSTAATAGSRQGSAERGVAPGMSPESIGAAGANANRRQGGAAGGAGVAAANPVRSNRTGGGDSALSAASLALDSASGVNDLHEVRVVADEENNALIIYATGKQYAVIKEALDRLDVAATQIIIEASILEVTLTDELRYGLEWTFKNKVSNGYSGVGLLTGEGGTPAATAPGFSYSVTNSVGDISAVLNALSQDSLINVISTPSVMVLDNHTATIQVGDQVPVLQGQTIGVGGNSVQNIAFRDTGVNLVVTPSVNAGGLVTMDIEQSVTDVGSIDSATGQRSFLARSISSRVAVRSSESVVLGGLIRENASAGQSGLPLLRNIPVLGALFSANTRDSRRTELLVIITPRALFNEDDLREVSREMRSQVRFMELIDNQR